jgi:outer membrane protein assembly factor BamB
LLHELAGEKAPVLEGDKPDDPAARTKWKDAWASWWKEHAAETDLGRLRADARPLLGYTLLCEVRGNEGRIAELGRDGKVRWEFNTNVNFPVDAQIVGGQRVLVAEYNGGRVTERDFTGKVLWEKKDLAQPVNAQRLANGNTFIATRGQLLEVDRAGKEIINITRPNDVHAAGKTHDGRVVCINDNGQCTLFDAKGTEIKSFSVQPISGFTSGLEVLPNNHLLIVQQQTQKIVEYDLTGKLVWEVKSPPGPITASRARNGNTLVATQDGGAYEIDRTGKVLWEHKDECRLWRTRRR